MKKFKMFLVGFFLVTCSSFGFAMEKNVKNQEEINTNLNQEEKQEEKILNQLTKETFLKKVYENKANENFEFNAVEKAADIFLETINSKEILNKIVNLPVNNRLKLFFEKIQDKNLKNKYEFLVFVEKNNNSNLEGEYSLIVKSKIINNKNEDEEEEFLNRKKEVLNQLTEDAFLEKLYAFNNNFSEKDEIKILKMFSNKINDELFIKSLIKRTPPMQANIFEYTTEVNPNSKTALTLNVDIEKSKAENNAFKYSILIYPVKSHEVKKSYLKQKININNQQEYFNEEKKEAMLNYLEDKFLEELNSIEYTPLFNEQQKEEKDKLIEEFKKTIKSEDFFNNLLNFNFFEYEKLFEKNSSKTEVYIKKTPNSNELNNFKVNFLIISPNAKNSYFYNSNMEDEEKYLTKKRDIIDKIENNLISSLKKEFSEKLEEFLSCEDFSRTIKKNITKKVTEEFLKRVDSFYFYDIISDFKYSNYIKMFSYSHKLKNSGFKYFKIDVYIYKSLKNFKIEIKVPDLLD